MFFNVLHINLFLFQFSLDIKVILLLRKKNKIYEAALKEEMESSFHEDTSQKGKEIARKFNITQAPTLIVEENGEDNLLSNVSDIRSYLEEL